MGNDSHRYRHHEDEARAKIAAASSAAVPSDALTLPLERLEHVDMPHAGEVLAERYTLHETLGVGTYGQVFAAWDAVRSHHVAIKVLRDMTPAAILRFKHEFRALNELRHPNLVRVYKLGRDQHIWFIAMELIQGVPFTVEASAPQHIADPDIHHAETLWLEPQTRTQTDHHASSVASSLQDDDVLAPLFEVHVLSNRLFQLARGVHTLHQTSIVHCDLKPSNILVTPDERVVILDFGVAKNVSPLGAHHQEDGLYAGTRVYMAPEIGRARTTTPAVDWYSTGMMLAELLSGYHASILANTPYDTLQRRFHEAQKAFPAYQALFELCLGLLHPDPEQRAGYSEIVQHTQGVSPGEDAWKNHAEAHFVGRTHELRILHDLYDRFVAGDADTLIIEGEFGVGKSALCRQFLQEVILSDTPSYVLFARCQSDELLGYRAFDEVVDGLAAVLRAIPPEERDALLMHCTPTLYALFPALQTVAPAAQSATAQTEPDSPEDALYALQHLLVHVARKRRIVIWVDDVHNADRDSLRWLARIFGPGVRPNVLLLLTQRPTATPHEGPVDIDTLGYAVSRMTLHAFDEATAQAAVQLWLPPHLREDANVVFDILTLAQGRPDALRSLCRYAEQMQALPNNSTLDSLIQHRIRQLSDLEYELLCITALAMGPIDIRMLLTLCNAPPVEIDHALYSLVKKMLIRSATTIADEHYELWDQSIYRTLRRDMSVDAQRDLHKRFADIGAHQPADVMPPALLIAHLLRAEEIQRAEAYALQRARASEKAGAWESAAQLYRLLLSIQRDQDKTPPAALMLRVIECYLRTGRLEDAATLMVELAARSPRQEAHSLHLRAAETFTLCGQLDAGNAHAKKARELTGKVHFMPPMAPQILRVAALRLKLEMRLRKLDVNKLSDRPLDPVHTTLLGTYRVSGIDIGMTDAMRAFEFSMRELDLALDLQRPLPIARALSSFCSFTAGGGIAQQQRAYQWLDLAQTLARNSDDRITEEWIRICRCTIDYQIGHYRSISARLEQSHAWLTEHASHQSLILAYLDVYRVLAAIVHGDLDQLRKIYYGQIADTRIRNNPSAELSVTLTGFITWFIDDAPDAARAVLRRMDTAAPRREHSYQLDHYLRTRSEIDLCLYEQRSSEYSKHIHVLRRFERSLLAQNVEAIHDEALFMLGRLTLAHARFTHTLSARQRRELRRWAARLAASHVPLSHGWGHHLFAGLAYLDDDLPRARRLLQRSIDAHHHHGLRLFEALSRAAGASANLLPHGGDPLAPLHDLRVVRPDRLLRSYHPYL